MHSACDIEGHVGTDNRRYLLDFARSFPPEDPAEVHHLSHLLNDGTPVSVCLPHGHPAVAAAAAAAANNERRHRRQEEQQSQPQPQRQQPPPQQQQQQQQRPPSPPPQQMVPLETPQRSPRTDNNNKNNTRGQITDMRDSGGGDEGGDGDGVAVTEADADTGDNATSGVEDEGAQLEDDIPPPEQPPLTP
ncbi:unnamed protein product, partial [Sphacelaria rigidula]